MAVWVNGAAAARFEPFDRNRTRRQNIDLPLVAGANDVIVHCEDLCERDTNWLFELRLVSDITLGLSLATPVDAAAVREIERTLGSLRFDKAFYGDEPVHLVVDRPPRRSLALALKVRQMHRAAVAGLEVALTVTPQSSRLRAFEGRDAGEGCCAVELAMTHGGVRVRRTIGGTFLAGIKVGAGGAIAARKREALDYLAAAGGLDPARALAQLATEHNRGEAERLLAGAIGRVTRREDCSDFAMVPLLWACRRHGETQLSPGLWQRARAAILGWRYWLDEPGNDVMWFWSENHVLCFHVSQYLAGQLFPDETFSCSGRTGRAQTELARRRLGRWFDAVEAHGLVEWNSSAYYPIDFIGLFALLELADDAGLRARARRVLDMIFVTVALHSQRGILGGTMGRAYEKELLAGPAAELSGYAYVAWGDGWISRTGASLPMFCLSDYVPPAITDALVAPPAGTHLQAAYSQGVDDAGRLRLWKDRASQLSTIVDHHPGAPGHQQHVVDVMLAGNPGARFWVNHPGDGRPWGHHRPSYWAGNGRLPTVAQHGPVALLIFHGAGENDLPWSHLLAPREVCDDIVVDGDWLFAKSGAGFAAFHAPAGLLPVETGLFAGKEWRSPGQTTAWVVAVGSGDDDAAFAAFRAHWLSAVAAFDSTSRTMTVAAPETAHLCLAAGAPLRADGVTVPFAPLDPTPHVAFGGDPMRPWQALNQEYTSAR